jgi:hypothetical protein
LDFTIHTGLQRGAYAVQRDFQTILIPSRLKRQLIQILLINVAVENQHAVLGTQAV